MSQTTRRALLRIAAAGSASTALGMAFGREIEAHSPQSADNAQSRSHQKQPISGPLAEATMSFGQWPADSSVDRMRVANPGSSNTHQLVPYEVRIKAGGTVDFIIAGSHQVAIYDDGTQPGDINDAVVLPAPLSNLIDDVNRRIYRGLSPSGVPANFFGPGVPAAAIPAPSQDRVESVVFPDPGSFLVICAVRLHFLDGMYGFVTVVP